MVIDYIYDVMFFAGCHFSESTPEECFSNILGPFTIPNPGCQSPELGCCYGRPNGNLIKTSFLEDSLIRLKIIRWNFVIV